MPTLKFAVPETWHEPIAHAPVLSERRRGTQWLPTTIFLAVTESRRESGQKRGTQTLLSSEPAYNIRTRPFYSRGQTLSVY